MISGNELRNTFNLTMRSLYSIKDSSSGSASGRSYTAKINSKSYVDIYISRCYDEIDKFPEIIKMIKSDLKQIK